MNIPESSYREARGAKIVAVRFRKKASADEVVARLLDAVRGTELSLHRVFGDGDRVEGRNAAWSASSWRAELFWHSPTLMSGWRLEVFLKRAEIFLELPRRVRLEQPGGHGDPREDPRGVRRARLWQPCDDARTPLDKKS